MTRCDDDNDMQMAAAVAHAYLPGVATESVRVAINNDPSRFSVSPTVRPREMERERVHLVGSHGRWKRPCLQTAHMTI